MSASVIAQITAIVNSNARRLGKSAEMASEAAAYIIENAELIISEYGDILDGADEISSQAFAS